MRFLVIAALCQFSTTFAETTAAELPKDWLLQRDHITVLIPFEGGVVFRGDDPTGSFYWWLFDEAAPRKLEIPGVDELLSINSTEQKVEVLGVTRGRVIMRTKGADNEWRTLPTPPELSNDTWAHVIPSTHPFALITNDQMWWFTGKEWTSRREPTAQMEMYDFDSHSPWGSIQFLNEESLFVGTDNGEFGGGVWELDVSRTNSVWKQLGGEVNGKGVGVFGKQCMTNSIVRMNSGQLLVSTGLAHGGSHSAGIYRSTNDRGWERLLYCEHDKYEGPTTLPEPTSVAHVAMNSRGEIFVLAPAIGVLQLRNEQFERFVDCCFFSIEKNMPRMGSDIGGIVGCAPSKLCVLDNRDVFVAAGAFGVLGFRRVGDVWRCKQVLVPSPDESK